MRGARLSDRERCVLDALIDHGAVAPAAALSVFDGAMRRAGGDQPMTLAGLRAKGLADFALSIGDAGAATAGWWATPAGGRRRPGWRRARPGARGEGGDDPRLDPPAHPQGRRRARTRRRMSGPLAPSRPALRYHGGKWKLAPWIISHFPPHRVYVEPFGGAASVLLRKPRSYAEVYNDLDSEVVAYFRVLRESALAAELIRRLQLTPFARAEFNAAYEDTDDAIESARRLVIRSFMGFGSDGCNADNGRTGFRANSNRSGTTPAHDWRNLPGATLRLTERLQGVVIENRHAGEVMAQHDSPQTLHYLDPPYVHETRAAADPKQYKHEMTDTEHRQLISLSGALSGAVILSGYRCALYDEALAGWRRIDKATHADGARDRVESLWLNERAAASAAPTLFCRESATDREGGQINTSAHSRAARPEPRAPSACGEELDAKPSRGGA